MTKHCSHSMYSLSNPAVLIYIFNQEKYLSFHHSFYISERLQTMYSEGKAHSTEATERLAKDSNCVRM